MKEPSSVEWAEHFLREAHGALSEAALVEELCNLGNEARFLIGRALTLAGRCRAGGVLARRPDEALEKAKEAHGLLRQAAWSPEAGRAEWSCADPVRFLSEAGRLGPEFRPNAEDRKAPLRFFGNVRIANGGRGPASSSTGRSGSARPRGAVNFQSPARAMPALNRKYCPGAAGARSWTTGGRGGSQAAPRNHGRPKDL